MVEMFKLFTCEPIFSQKVNRFLKILITNIFYSWRFYSWGKRSTLTQPDLLFNTGEISIGNYVEIRKGARLEAVGQNRSQTPKIEIGDGTSIHLYFHCGAASSVKIGKNVLIAGRVYITDHNHEFENSAPLSKDSGLNTEPVVIEDEVWLGEGAVILKGVTVGKRSVIGANAVVTKDVPPYTVVGGVPARIIRKIDNEQG
jgi:acetyltransferase-like isoleucine patch superfamily enzyme